MSQRLKQVSSEELQVSEGSLYPALHKREWAGLVTALEGAILSGISWSEIARQATSPRASETAGSDVMSCGIQAMSAHRILIVNHEIAAARELEARLTRFGYAVAGVASSARDAIALTTQTRPNVVLMSIVLEGGVDGVAAADEIRQRWPIPVVFLLAVEPDEAILRRTAVTEPFGYVVKPYADRELQMNIEMALYKEEMTRQALELEDRFFVVSIDLLCFLDFSGYFKRLNPAWERTLGFTRDELMSRPFLEFVHPDDRERTLNQNKAVRGGGQARSFENRYLCKDGSYRWLMWNAAPDSDHQVIYSVARDITERKQAEEERERMVRELQTALAEVKTLQEILPICSYCQKIRDDENYWQTVESYISAHTNSQFSHSICPACYKNEVEPQFEALEREKGMPPAPTHVGKRRRAGRGVR